MKLSDIEKIFNEVSKSIKDFPDMPFPEYGFIHEVENSLMVEELGYDKDVMHN